MQEPAELPHDSDMSDSDPPKQAVPVFETASNSYGIYCVYPGGRPTFTPDELYTLNQVADSSNFTQDTSSRTRPWWSVFGSSLENLETNYFAPFLNASVFHLMKWFYSGSNLKSLGELDCLINEVILADDFDKKDFSGFQAAHESEHLDNFSSDPHSWFSTDDVLHPVPATRTSIRSPT